MKQDLIKKIKDILIEHGGMLMPEVETTLGDVYTVIYNEDCDSVEVNVIADMSQGLKNPKTVTIDIEYLSEKEIAEILKKL